MALVKRKHKGSYTWPVKLKIAEDGRYETHTFRGVFKKFSQNDFDSIVEGINNGNLKDRDVTDQVLIGWSGIEDDEGRVLEFNNPDDREDVLNVPGFCAAIVGVFFETGTGGRVKN